MNTFNHAPYSCGAARRVLRTLLGIVAGVVAPAMAEATLFVAVDDRDDRFVLELTDPATIARARELIGSSDDLWIVGHLDAGDAGYNRDPRTGRQWPWHLVQPIEFAETTAEAMQTSIAGVEWYLEDWFRMDRIAIGARIESEGVTLLHGRFINESVRAVVGTGQDIQIAGFVVRGTRPQTVLVRALGPGLRAHGVTAALADPELELHNQTTGAVIATNDNWSSDAARGDEIAAVATRVGAAPLARDSLDAALVMTLEPGVYTAVVRGKNQGTGNALIELFDANNSGEAGTCRFINISGRANVGAGENVLISGFVVAEDAMTVLVRGVGPSLATHGVANPLADPCLELYDQRTGRLLYSNDNWDMDRGHEDRGARERITAAARNVGAQVWAAGTRDAALLVTLPAGIYTAVVKGTNASNGVAVVEVFEVSGR